MLEFGSMLNRSLNMTKCKPTCSRHFVWSSEQRRFYIRERLPSLQERIEASQSIPDLMEVTKYISGIQGISSKTFRRLSEAVTKRANEIGEGTNTVSLVIPVESKGVKFSKKYGVVD